MKLSNLALPVVALTLSRTAAGAADTPCSESDIDVDVAIIGGGSAGIHAAIQLRDAGATVAVVEKKSQIGGHAETYTNPRTGVPGNVGVSLFENIDVVSAYFARLNVSAARVNPLNGGGASPSYDFSSGVRIPAPNASEAAARQEALQAAVRSYKTNVLAKYPRIDQGFHVPDPVPEELTVPFAELAQRYGFSALLTVIAQFNWFTGDISAIPALYSIKGLGPGLLNSIFGEFIVSASGNTRALYDAAAAELGDSVLLNADVVEVRRDVPVDEDEDDATGVTVLVQQPDQPLKLIRARKLLFAIPPTLDNVGAYDLSAEESGLFSKFSALGYWAAVANIPGLNTGLTNVGAWTPFNQPVIPGPNGIDGYGSPDDFVVLVAFRDTAYSDADGQAVVRENLATLGAVGAVPADAAERATFPFSSNHGPYNLRVSAEEIRAGFYRRFLALEGARNTYWAGAALTGHNSALVWNFNLGTVLPGLKKDLGL